MTIEEGGRSGSPQESFRFLRDDNGSGPGLWMTEFGEDIASYVELRLFTVSFTLQVFYYLSIINQVLRMVRAHE